MNELLKKILIENHCNIQESYLLDESDFGYWQSTIIDERGFPISSGFNLEKMQARKVAISEFIERKYAKEVFRNNPQEWGFDKIKTLCGFAAGFNKYNARMRSLNEAVERWTMSQWIDEGKFIPQVSMANNLDPACHLLMEPFDDVLFYFIKIPIVFDYQYIEVPVAQTFGIKGNGIYPGSSTQSSKNGYFEHALVETYRHYQGVKNNPKRDTHFPDDKIYFFSENKNIALMQMNAAVDKSWSTPRVILHKTMDLFEGSAFLARTIIGGWTSWDEGPLERFLY